HEDQDALRERETNLREYEERLRAWQAELDAGRPAAGATQRPAGATVAPFQRPSSRTPFSAEDPALQAAWEKLHRARELFEAEQMHLRGDRIALKDQDEELKRRDAEISAREVRVAEREALLLAAMPAPDAPGEPVGAEHTMSAVTRLARSPLSV